MFQQAAGFYGERLAHIVAASGDGGGSVVGLCTFLTPELVITADHVWMGAEGNGSTPAIGRLDGMFSAEVVRRWEIADLALLRLRDRIASRGEPRSSVQLHATSIGRKVSWGSSVGLLGFIRRVYDDGKSRTSRLFSAGHIARLDTSWDGASVWQMDSGFVEPGFSGGPAFAPDGTFVGVIVATSATAARSEYAQVQHYPIISPVDPNADGLLELLT